MKRLLVPIDFSTTTPRVLEFVGLLAKPLAAEVCLVHVKELPSAIPPNPIGYGMAGMPELMPTSSMSLADPVPSSVPNESEKLKLTEWSRELERQGLKVTSQEVIGGVVEEILRIADEIDVDFIVMGRHGHGAMYNLLVGSVTEGVLKHSRRPVLLVPEFRS
jgi:nucleotide-binding universal stress UspA family protein